MSKQSENDGIIAKNLDLFKSSHHMTDQAFLPGQNAKQRIYPRIPETVFSMLAEINMQKLFHRKPTSKFHDETSTLVIIKRHTMLEQYRKD